MIVRCYCSVADDQWPLVVVSYEHIYIYIITALWFGFALFSCVERERVALERNSAACLRLEPFQSSDKWADGNARAPQPLSGFRVLAACRVCFALSFAGGRKHFNSREIDHNWSAASHMPADSEWKPRFASVICILLGDGIWYIGIIFITFSLRYLEV